MNFRGLTDLQIDALQEISNIGMGHAATALSQLLDEPLLIRVPEVRVTEVAKVPAFLGGAEKIVAGVTLQVLGDARGTILLIFPEESAIQLVKRLLGAEQQDVVFDEVSASTLKEVGNILASAYLNALGSLLHLTLIPSVPMLAHDMAGAVADCVLIELAKKGDLALMMEADFLDRSGVPSVLGGHFFLLPDPESLSIVLDALGVMP